MSLGMFLKSNDIVPSIFIFNEWLTKAGKLGVTGIKWKGDNQIEGADFHVLRNNIPSESLTRILQIERNPEKSSDASELLDNEELVFLGKFSHDESIGLSVDKKTGIVTAFLTADPRGLHLHNFIIHVKLTDKSVEPPKDHETFIRVHIHDMLVNEWLTPSSLTIRQGTSGHRLSLLAEFSDKIIGAIPSNSAIEWTSNCKYAEIDKSTGRIKVDEIPSGPPDGPGEASHIEGNTHIATITAKLPDALMGGTAVGKVKLAEKWSSLKSVAKPILFVPAKYPTAAETMAAIRPSRNFLFLSEGFTKAQKGLFYELVQRLVYKLRTSGSIKPLNILSNSLNYWAVFVESPSDEGGVSLLNEFRLIEGVGDLRGSGSENVPFPDPKDGPDGIFSLDRLVFEAGMPIPDDAIKNFDKKKDEWSIAYGNHISDHVNLERYKEWQEWSIRRMADEKDTAFGLAYGSHPIVSEFRVPRIISFHPYRMTREELDQFLSQITFSLDDQVIPIGEVWGKDKDGNEGFSYSNVIFICGGSPDGGAQPGYIALSIDSRVCVKLEPVGTNMAVKLIPYVPTGKITTAFFGTLVHEMGHLFGLLDEYGERPHLGTEIEKLYKEIRGNTQVESTLRDDAGRLDPDKITWKWHRIEKAGFLMNEAEPQPNTDPIEIKIQVAQSEIEKRQFNIGDIIKIRGPVLLSRDNRVSKKLKITDIKASVPGSSTLKDLTIQLIEEEPLDPFIFYPIWFPSGSTIFVPRIGKGPENPELFLVAPKILDHIRNSNGPLNAPKGQNANHACEPDQQRTIQDKSAIQVATNLPDEDQMPKKRPEYRSWYVGLYEGGNQAYCGVYHPSGACLMRSSNPITNESGKPIKRDEKGRRISLYNFCPVCKYILVDLINPILHPIIDDDYGRRYPYDG